MSFSESSLLKKFQELNSTQQSVQTLSLWLIHHRKNANTVIATWLAELIKTARAERKLTFIYLANDILQNSRRKGDEYLNEFRQVLREAFEHTALYSDEKTKFTLERILNIWKDRRIYSDDFITDLKSHMHSTKSLVDVSALSDPNSESSSAAIQTASSQDEDPRNKRKYLTQQQGSTPETSVIKTAKPSLKEEVMKELAQTGSNIQAPEANELVNLLQELEKSASSDAVVRSKIAELPSKVSDLNELKNLRDKSDALELARMVNEALQLLDNYNARLQQELISRKQTALLLGAFVRQQLNEIDNDQKAIEDWQKKLKQVQLVKSELETHLDSLPDLATIDQVAELTPLPSAGDLFSS